MIGYYQPVGGAFQKFFFFFFPPTELMLLFFCLFFFAIAMSFELQLHTGILLFVDNVLTLRILLRQQIFSCTSEITHTPLSKVTDQDIDDPSNLRAIEISD